MRPAFTPALVALVGLVTLLALMIFVSLFVLVVLVTFGVYSQPGFRMVHQQLLPDGWAYRYTGPRPDRTVVDLPTLAIACSPSHILCTTERGMHLHPLLYSATPTPNTS